jgi:hypothetical protein
MDRGSRCKFPVRSAVSKHFDESASPAGNARRSEARPTVTVIASLNLPLGLIHKPTGKALNDVSVRALDDGDVRSRLLDLGLNDSGGDQRTPQALADLVMNEADRCKAVMIFLQSANFARLDLDAPTNEPLFSLFWSQSPLRLGQ